MEEATDPTTAGRGSTLQFDALAFRACFKLQIA